LAVFGALISGVAVGTLPIFTNAAVFAPIEVSTLLMITALFGLRRPRRIRLPRKRTFS